MGVSVCGMSTRLPTRDMEAEELAHWHAQTALLSDLEFERDPPLTEHERLFEELRRSTPGRKVSLRRRWETY